MNLCRQREIALELAAALDAWACGKWTKSGREEDLQLQEKLLRISGKIDPDPWRNQVREAVIARDINVPRHLAEQEDSLDQPVASLTLLAQTLDQLGDTNAAADFLLRCHPRFRDDFRVNHALGLYLNRASPPRPNEAIRFAQAAAALRPNDPGVINNLGWCLGVLDRLDEAFATLREAIAVGGPDWGWGGAYANLGVALAKQDKLDEAIAEYRKAIELDPDYTKAYYNLGNALKDQGKLDEAIAEYRKAIELDPNYAEVYSNLGNALWSQAKRDEAIESFRKAIEVDPDYAKAYGNLGSALAKQGKLDEAIAEFRKAIELDPTSVEAYTNLGLALKNQGKVDEAIAEYRKAIELDPNCAQTNASLGNTLREQHKLDEAVDYLERAVELRPNVPGTINNLGLAFYAQGRLDEAIATYRQAIAVAGPDYGWGGINTNLGNALLKQGKLDEAINECRKAIERDPDYAHAYSVLAVALIKQDKTDEAIVVCQSALARLREEQASVFVKCLASTASNSSWRLATAADVSKREPTKAVELAHLAIEHQPDVANHWNNLGVAQYRTGNWQAAIEALEKADALIENGDRAHRMFFAMARWQLEDKEEARELYAQGAAWIAKQQEDDEELNRFRDEAEQLMGIGEEDRDRLIEEYNARTADETAEPAKQNFSEEGKNSADGGQDNRRTVAKGHSSVQRLEIDLTTKGAGESALPNTPHRPKPERPGPRSAHPDGRPLHYKARTIEISKETNHELDRILQTIKTVRRHYRASRLYVARVLRVVRMCSERFCSQEGQGR